MGKRSAEFTVDTAALSHILGLVAENTRSRCQKKRHSNARNVALIGFGGANLYVAIACGGQPSYVVGTAPKDYFSGYGAATAAPAEPPDPFAGATWSQNMACRPEPLQGKSTGVTQEVKDGDKTPHCISEEGYAYPVGTKVFSEEEGVEYQGRKATKYEIGVCNPEFYTPLQTAYLFDSQVFKDKTVFKQGVTADGRKAVAIDRRNVPEGTEVMNPLTEDDDRDPNTDADNTAVFKLYKEEGRVVVMESLAAKQVDGAVDSGWDPNTSFVAPTDADWTDIWCNLIKDYGPRSLEGAQVRLFKYHENNPWMAARSAELTFPKAGEIFAFKVAEGLPPLVVGAWLSTTGVAGAVGGPMDLPFIDSQGKVIGQGYYDASTQELKFNRIFTEDGVKIVDIGGQMYVLNPAAMDKEYQEALRQFQEATIQQPPDGWKPPSKDYCGEKMDHFYALKFLAEVISRKGFSANRLLDPRFAGLKVEDVELFKGTKTYAQEEAEIEQRLKDKNCYDYPGGGHVYQDYKYMRNQKYPGFDSIETEVLPRFGPDMTTEEALKLCEEIVAGWGW